MAKEIKSINVNPSDEEETINVWQTFGWEFKSTQEVKTSDQHWEDNDNYYTKKGEHYVKVTFERDPAQQNYTELVSLEKQYNDVPGPRDPPVRFGMLWLIISVIGLIIFTIPGILIIVWRFASYPKKKKQWEDDYSNWKNKRAEILAKAKSLA